VETGGGGAGSFQVRKRREREREGGRYGSGGDHLVV